MLNQCQFIGNLGSDPEVRHLQSGDKVVNLRLAVTERWRDKQSGEKREKTEWIPITVFNQNLIKVAEQYLKKGSKIYVSGSWQTRKWQDNAGNDRYSTEVVLQNYNGQLTMLDKPSGDAPAQSASMASSAAKRIPAGTPKSFARDLDDEIPF
jgi:single-strand DNA-binding protein